MYVCMNACIYAHVSMQACNNNNNNTNNDDDDDDDDNCCCCFSRF